MKKKQKKIKTLTPKDTVYTKYGKAEFQANVTDYNVPYVRLRLIDQDIILTIPKSELLNEKI